MTARLARSYRYCEAVARAQAGNFYHAFRILPSQQRRAMCALYAFLRHTDDLGDCDRPAAERAADLEQWRMALHRACSGWPTHPLHEAIVDTMRTYNVPSAYLEATIDGVLSDLRKVRFATFEELYPYCYRVASVVGMACVRIWGCRDDKALAYAEKAGIAFQLTNILRDIREDAAHNRVYLPAEDLARFDCTEEDLFTGHATTRFQALMKFEAGRAARYYDEAAPLAASLPPPGRAVFQIMSRTYRGLLHAIEVSGYDVFHRRIQVPPWRKLAHVAAALPVRWGWL